MIEVRIRPESEAEAVRLCDWPATRLDEVIPTIAGWGVVETESGRVYSGGEANLSGQFIVATTGGYFEVAIHEADDG